MTPTNPESAPPAGNFPSSKVVQVNSGITIGQASINVTSTVGQKATMSVVASGSTFVSNGTARFEIGTGTRAGAPITVSLLPEPSEKEGDAIRVTIKTARWNSGTSVPTGRFEIGYEYDGVAKSDRGTLADVSTETWTFDAALGDSFEINLYLQGSRSLPTSGGPTPVAGVTILVEPIIPDIAVTDAVTHLAASVGASNFRKIPIKYVVKDTEVPIEIRFAVYQSSDMKWDASDTKLNADVMTAAGQTPTVKRKQGTYTGDSLYLKSNVSLKYGQRFLIVKADPDKAIREFDEDNNTMFVIPLIPENQPAAFLLSGTFAMYSNTATEDAVTYGIAGRISRDTADFTNALQDISTTWSNAGGTFKDEEPISYRGDDRRLNKSLAGPLSTLITIIKETEKQKRFSMSGLKITEAFDAQMEHRIASLHYEGRSIDFSASGDRAKRLAGLTLLAGFHWNVNEKPSAGSQHVHLSHRGTRAKLSITGVVQALTWGNKKDLISDARFADLKSRLDKALAIAKDPKLSAAVRATRVKFWLDSLVSAIPDSAPSGFVTTMASSISGLPAQKTHIHLLLKRNAALVRNNPSLWN